MLINNNCYTLLKITGTKCIIKLQEVKLPDKKNKLELYHACILNTLLGMDTVY